MKSILIMAMALVWSCTAMADDSSFSTHLYAKFQVKACTTCHDYFEKDRGGLAFKSHKGRSPDMCVYCHAEGVTGFRHSDDWFAQPGLYTSGMDAQQTCEAIKTALHAKFKNRGMVARQMELHLFEDPRVLWGIEGAAPKSGQLPGGELEKELVKGGLTEWKAQDKAWVAGGMSCK